MNLLAPTALLAALFAVPIVAMYILKMRRPQRVVPSTFLWQPVLHDIQANSPWQKLRTNLLLMLQLLALAALVLALARPYLLRAAPVAGDVVVVLDVSALMNATDVSPTRLDAAKARIASLIDDLPPGDEMSIVAMSRHPRVLIAQSSDHAALHDALNRASAGAEASSPDAALAVAAGLVRGSKRASLYLYRAAGGPVVAVPSELRGRSMVVTLGGKLHNLGIVSFAASLSADGSVAALARVSNLGRRVASAALQMDIASGDPLHWQNQVDLHPISLPPGASTTVVRARLPGNVVAIRAHLIGDDDLALDDWAWATVATPASRHVILVASPDDTFAATALQAALSLSPGVGIQTISPDRYSAGTASKADLVVFNTWLPRRLPATSVLAIAPPENAHSPLGLAVGRYVVASKLQKGDGALAATLLGNLDLSHIAVSEAAPLQTPSWAEAVLSTGGRPLMVAGSPNGRQLAALGLDLHNTDLALSAAFPILMHRLLDWLSPPVLGPAGVYRPGDAITLTPPSNLASLPHAQLNVVTPSNQRITVAPPFPVQPFVSTDVPGLYTVEQSTQSGLRRSYVAVNLFPLAGSQATNGETTGGANGAQDSHKTLVPVELAPFVAAFALLVLGGEWWVTARRR
jgi:hypothetical protein